MNYCFKEKRIQSIRSRNLKTYWTKSRENASVFNLKNQWWCNPGEQTQLIRSHNCSRFFHSGRFAERIVRLSSKFRPDSSLHEFHRNWGQFQESRIRPVYIFSISSILAGLLSKLDEFRCHQSRGPNLQSKYFRPVFRQNIMYGVWVYTASSCFKTAFELHYGMEYS